MILTMAIADSIHILVSMQTEIGNGFSKRDAIVESLRINFVPVMLTSLTTAVGFLSMNFSDSPPLRHLGNITAAGVTVAFLLSITFLPAAMAILPVKIRRRDEKKAHHLRPPRRLRGRQAQAPALGRRRDRRRPAPWPCRSTRWPTST